MLQTTRPRAARFSGKLAAGGSVCQSGTGKTRAAAGEPGAAHITDDTVELRACPLLVFFARMDFTEIQGCNDPIEIYLRLFALLASKLRRAFKLSE